MGRMVAPIITVPNLTQHLYVHALTAAYRSRNWLYDPDFASLQDVEIWEKINRDPVVRQAIAQRVHGVAGRKWVIQAADQDDKDCVLAAKIMNGLTLRIRHFSRARASLAKGVFRGSSFGWMQSRVVRDSIAGTQAMDWWTCTGIKDIDRRRIRQVPVSGDDGRLVGTKAEIWSVKKETWKELDQNSRRALVEFIYDDEEERLGYGKGLLESLYFYHYAKTQVLRYGLQGLQRWALGLLVAKVAPNAAGDTTRTNEDVKDEMLDQLSVHDSSHVLAIDGRDSLEVHETSGTGHEIVSFLLGYLDDKILALGCGSVLPSGGGSDVGSLARAQVEQETSESLLQHDADTLYDVLTHDVIGAFWDFNRENFEKLCPNAVMPRIVPVQERFRDPQTAVEVINKALASGVPLVKEEVYDALGFSAPREDQDTFDSIPAPAMNEDEFALKDKALSRPTKVA